MPPELQDPERCVVGHLRSFWETDVDLDRSALVTSALRFSAAAVADEALFEEPASAQVQKAAPTARISLLFPLILIAVVAVLGIIQWPDSAKASLLISLALAAFVILSALIQLSRTRSQHRENRALRKALRKSRLAQEQLRFQEICETTRPAA